MLLSRTKLVRPGAAPFAGPCPRHAVCSWVLSGAGDQAATAAQVVLATPPADDAGAETADRYDWQAAMAAADGLALYFLL